MAGNTRPDWVNDEGPDAADLAADQAIMADIERAMAARGYTEATPSVEQQVEGEASPPLSNQATSPGNQPEGVEAGSQPSADAPGAPLTAGGAVAPGSESEQLPPPEPGTQAPPPESAPLNVVLPSGDTFPMSNEQANYLIQLHNWIDSKSPELKATWKGIEDGTHQAIPAEDAVAYQAWVAAGRPTATQPAVPERPQFDTQFVDQKFLDYVDKLEAKVKETGTPHSTVPQPPAQPQIDVQAQATILANRQVQVQQALDQSTAAIREKYGLTPEQVAHLNRITPALGIIPGIAEKHRTYSPLGDLISDAPMEAVFTEAFEVAMTADPTLRAVRDEMIVQRHLATNSDTMKNVASKKANAASLATAPSAAVPGKNLDPRKMTPQQRHDAMVAELAEAMSDNGQG